MLASGEVVNEVPLHPYVVGAGVLGLFILLLIATWFFGKGRPHA
jgi:hypothetical protein